MFEDLFDGFMACVAGAALVGIVLIVVGVIGLSV